MSRLPRHLADPLPLRRRWQLWTGVGLAVLLVLTAAAWVGTSGPDRQPADLSAAASGPADAGTSTTETAPESTVAQAPGDEPKNLLANASFEDGAGGGARSAGPG
jgi:hypothetical protein